MSEPIRRQSVRQAARRAAFASQAALRAERQERDKRVAAIAMAVLVALGERDAAVSKHEQRAGVALRQLFDEERLTPAEVAQWCGPGLTRQEIARLRRCGDYTSALERTRERDAGTASASDGASRPGRLEP